MATLQILVPGPSPSPHRKVTITSIGTGLAYTFPLLSDLGLDGLAGKWTTIPRPGRDDLKIYAGPGSPTASIKIKVGGEDLSRSCEQDLQILHAIASGDQPVIVACGQFNRYSSTGTWVVTSMAVANGLRVQGSNDFARAEVTLGLEQSLTPTQAQQLGR